MAEESDLGFIFYPRQAGSPGSPRLDVIMHTTPTYRHFDPERLTLPTATDGDSLSRFTFHHPWSGQTRYRVCPGRITIGDRIGKKVYAVSFGGHLTVISDPEESVFILTSPAPILSIIERRALATMLANEVEILLAERRARLDPRRFEEKLAQVRPLPFYAACIEALQDRFLHLPVAADSSLQHLEHFLRQEPTRLRALSLWPDPVPALDELL